MLLHYWCDRFEYWYSSLTDFCIAVNLLFRHQYWIMSLKFVCIHRLKGYHSSKQIYVCSCTWYRFPAYCKNWIDDAAFIKRSSTVLEFSIPVTMGNGLKYRVICIMCWDACVTSKPELGVFYMTSTWEVVSQQCQSRDISAGNNEINSSCLHGSDTGRQVHCAACSVGVHWHCRTIPPIDPTTFSSRCYITIIVWWE